MEKDQMRVRKVRAGWYTIEVVGFMAVLEKKHDREIYVDVVRDDNKSAPWRVYSRHDGVQRSDITDWHHAGFFSKRDARAFAMAVADWWVAIELNNEKDHPFPKDSDPQFRSWEADLYKRIEETRKELGL